MNHARSFATTIGVGSAFLLASLVFGPACSLQNQVGPNVTCADLMCGQVNACEDGIIAQCVDGHTVKYRVCGSNNICGETWQVTGQYRCAQEVTDCEGCRPDRTAGCATFATGTTSSSTTGSTSTTGAGGSGG